MTYTPAPNSGHTATTTLAPAFVVHTHYVQGQVVPESIIVVPLTRVPLFSETPSPSPFSDTEPEFYSPSILPEFWSRTVWQTERTPLSLAEHLAEWLGMDLADVFIAETTALPEVTA